MTGAGFVQLNDIQLIKKCVKILLNLAVGNRL